MAKKKISKGLAKEIEKARKKEFEKECAYVQEKLEEYCASEDHKRPTTHREFLSAGMLTMQGWMLGPTIGTLLGSLSKTAYGADCPTPDLNAGPAALVHIHSRGGQAIGIAGVSRQTNGSELDSFRGLGLGNNPTFAQPFANDARIPNVFGAGAGFLNGILDTTSAATRANVVQISIPLRDNGDDNAPIKSFLGQVEALGRAGEKLGFMGDDDSATGTNGAPNPAFGIPSSQPLQVRNQGDILQAVQLAGALENLNAGQEQALAKLVRNLSSSQVKKLTGLSGASNLAKAVECATEQNVKNIAEGSGNLATPNNIRAIWNNFAREDFGNGRFNQEAFGSMVYNTVAGNAAGCVLEVGGFDIHSQRDRGRTFQDQGEYGIARQVGKALETAAVLGRKVCVVLTTNGSNATDGDLNDTFRNDSSNFSVNHMFFYDPAGAPQTVGNLNGQIGGLRRDGTCDRDNFTATDIGAVSAMIYNYAIFSGVENKFDLVMGSNALSATEKNFARKLA